MNKKSKLGYIGIGIIISIVIYGLMIYFTIDDLRGTFLPMTTDGMSPTIVKGEYVEIDKYFLFENIAEGDVIAFFSGQYQDKLIVQRVVEIVQEKPLKVMVQGDSISESIAINTPVNEEEFYGKVVRIYPDEETKDKAYMLESSTAEEIDWVVISSNVINRDSIEGVRYP